MLRYTLVDYCLPFLYVQTNERKIGEYLTHLTGQALTPTQNSINREDACKLRPYEIYLSLTRNPATEPA